jgi:hypothetical protein
MIGSLVAECCHVLVSKRLGQRSSEGDAIRRVARTIVLILTLENGPSKLLLGRGFLRSDLTIVDAFTPGPPARD